MTTRNKLALLAGLLSATFAAVLLLLGAFIAISGGDARQSLLGPVVSIFPLLIAIACLSPRHRTPALRAVGGITAVAMAGILIASYVRADVEQTRRGRAIYFMTFLGAAGIAVKGRWPSA